MSKNTVSIVATGQAIPAGRGQVQGIIVNSHSSGVIKLIDAPNSPVGRVIFGGASGYTLPSGSSTIIFPSSENNSGLEFYEGVHAVIVSGSADIQLIFENA